MELIGTEAQLRRAPAAVEVEVAGSLVLHNLDTGGYVRLNPSARLLWQSLGEAATIETLAEAIVRRYGIDPGRARADAGEAIRALLDRGLVEVIADPA